MRWRKRDYAAMAFIFIGLPLLAFSMDGYLVHYLLGEVRHAVTLVNQVQGHYAHTVNTGATPAP